MVSKEDAISDSLRALSDSTRRGILGLLKKGKLSVLEIAEEFPMSRPAISKHLRILKEAGLVEEAPAGRQRIYTLERGPLRSLETWLGEFTGPSVEKVSATKPSRARPRPVSRSALGDWRVW